MVSFNVSILYKYNENKNNNRFGYMQNFSYINSIKLKAMKKLIQRNISLLQQLPAITRYIVVTCLVIYPAQLLLPLQFTDYIAQYSMYSDNFYIWQPITCTFAHADPFHLLFNILYFVLFGYFIEKQIGTKWYLFLVLCSITVSFIFKQMYWTGTVPILGLSSVVYGVTSFILFVKTHNDVILATLKVLAITCLLSDCKEWINHIDLTSASHIGGALGGVLVGIIYLIYSAVKKG